MQITRKDCELKTQRLVLRPKNQEDVQPIFDIATQYPEITQWMTWDPPKDIQETQHFFETTQENFPDKAITWAILLDGKFIGLVGLNSITRMERVWQVDVAELGYWLHPEFAGKGFMTEAGEAIVRFGFEKLDLHKITAGRYAQNPASGKVLEKLGFRHLGTNQQHHSRDGGKTWHDRELYELLSPLA